MASVEADLLSPYDVNMKTIDLNDNLKPLYFVCLEDWSEEIKEAENHKEVWYNKVKDKGLRVKFALASAII